MSTATRRSLQIEERPRSPIRSNGNGHARPNGNGHVRSNGSGHRGLAANGRVNGTNISHSLNGNPAAAENGYGHVTSNSGSHGRHLAKPRVFVAAENRLLREALSRMLTKNGDIEVINSEAAELFPNSSPYTAQDSIQKDHLPAHDGPGTPVMPAFHDAEILLLSSKGSLEQDLAAIRKIRAASPDLLILLIDATGDETNFLPCIRAGVRGYLPRDASAEDVVEAVKAIHAGRARLSGSALRGVVPLYRA